MKLKKYSRKDFLKKIGNISAGSLGIWLTGPTTLLKLTDFNKRKFLDIPNHESQTFSNYNTRLFDQDWYFKKGNAPGAEKISFDDSGWRKLDLPHDWSIEDLAKKNELPSVSISEGEWKFKFGDNFKWKNPSFNDHSWKKVQVPNYWTHYSDNEDSHEFGWYRKEIRIPDDLQGKDFLLNLGKIADSDETYFNGVGIGKKGEFPPHGKRFYWYNPPNEQVRVYRVPAHLVRKDHNIVSIRVYSHTGKGGIYNTEPTPEVIGPFSPESPGEVSTGHVMGGIGWYRKEFKLDDVDRNKKVSILFEGIYMNADVWINGHFLGNHPYGYTSYGYDLTPYLRFDDQPNVISVKVNNTGKNSRWYSGSGIYRHVKLIVMEPVHFSQWGIFATTPKVSREEAIVNLESTITNDSDKERNLELESILYSPKGDKVGQTRREIVIKGKNEIKRTQLIHVKNPLLWSPEEPNLYNIEVNILQDGKKIDHSKTHIGIRSIEVDAKNGLRINGKSVTLRGGCMHHCNGPLGSKAIDRAEERRVELMKKHGFNAIRTSHNPPSPAFLDACDRLGMFVMDEAFDCWDKGKKPMDYHLYFNEWWHRDIESMIKRDRNHPSVILWSIGNEIPDRSTPTGIKIGNELASTIRALDPTRPITEAINSNAIHHSWPSTSSAFAILDVGGYNYQWSKYESDHNKFPERVMVGTETFPMEAFINWKQVEEHSWVIGNFVWTGMDYLGESGIGHTSVTGKHASPESPLMPWPWFDSYCGDIDICGFKKPQSYYRDVVWRQSMLEMAVHSPIPKGQKEEVSRWGWPDEQQSWNWNVPNGEKLKVNVYSRYPKVRLELNGRKIGEKYVSAATKLTATFEVPYEPGELRVLGLKDGKVADRKVLKTTGKPKALRLIADRSKIMADRNDLCYVNVEVVDVNGEKIPNAELAIHFEVSGEGEIAAVGNGKPNDMRSFSSPQCTSFKGRCLVILRPNSEHKGSIHLKAMSSRLSSATIEVDLV